jgi:hypothetical protein
MPFWKKKKSFMEELGEEFGRKYNIHSEPAESESGPGILWVIAVIVFILILKPLCMAAC